MKGIGPQGLGTNKNKGYYIGEGKGCGCKGNCACGNSPMKKLTDQNGDKIITQADVLIAKGVFKSPMKQAVKDACYKKVKASYKVFPSAYASGAIAKCRKNK